MNFDQFVNQVQHRARLASKGEAARAVQATFQTLAERLSADETRHVASQLPLEFEIYFKVDEHGQRFSMNEFFERVATREQEQLPDAVYHVRVVLEVLQEAVSPGEIRHILSQLPDEWITLFAAGSQGDLKVENFDSAKR